MKTVNFGFLPLSIEMSSTSFSISKLISDQERIDLEHSLSIERSDNDGWCYPQINLNSNGFAVRPIPWYSLPCTNTIHFADDSTSDLVGNLTITFLGFLFGLHLRPEKWGFYRRTPIVKGRLNHFVLTNIDLAAIIEHFVQYVSALELKEKKLLFAAFNSHLGSMSFVLQHEQFDVNYKTFDTIYSLAIGGRDTHKRRIGILCEKFGIDTPDWAIVVPNGESKISKLRNDLIHELHFNGEPVGLNVLDDNMNLYLHRLNEVLLLGSVGFVLNRKEIAISSRGRYGIHLKW